MMEASVPIRGHRPSGTPAPAAGSAGAIMSGTVAGQGTSSVGRGYSDAVQDHFLNPRNVGTFDDTDPAVGTATAGARNQGAIIQMQIRVDQSGIINAICFKAYGCGATIAAASWVTEWVKGKNLAQVAELRSTDLVQALSLPPVKTHCAMLAEDAIKAAVDHYMQRQESS